MWPANLFYLFLGFFPKQDSNTEYLYDNYEYLSAYCHLLEKTYLLIEWYQTKSFIYTLMKIRPPTLSIRNGKFWPFRSGNFIRYRTCSKTSFLLIRYLYDIFIPTGSSMSARISFILSLMYREMLRYRLKCFWTILTMKLWQS